MADRSPVRGECSWQCLVCPNPEAPDDSHLTKSPRRQIRRLRRPYDPGQQRRGIRTVRQPRQFACTSRPPAPPAAAPGRQAQVTVATTTSRQARKHAVARRSPRRPERSATVRPTPPSGSSAITRATAAELAATSATSSAAGRAAPDSMSAASSFQPAGVLVAQLAARGALEPPDHAVPVAGEVGRAGDPRSSPAAGSGPEPWRRPVPSRSACRAAWALGSRAIQSSGGPAGAGSLGRDRRLPVEHVGHDGADELVRLVGHAAGHPAVDRARPRRLSRVPAA